MNNCFSVSRSHAIFGVCWDEKLLFVYLKLTCNWVSILYEHYTGGGGEGRLSKSRAERGGMGFKKFFLFFFLSDWKKINEGVCSCYSSRFWNCLFSDGHAGYWLRLFSFSRGAWWRVGMGRKVKVGEGIIRCLLKWPQPSKSCPLNSPAPPLLVSIFTCPLWRWILSESFWDSQGWNPEAGSLKIQVWATQETPCRHLLGPLHSSNVEGQLFFSLLWRQYTDNRCATMISTMAWHWGFLSRNWCHEGGLEMTWVIAFPLWRKSCIFLVVAEFKYRP